MDYIRLCRGEKLWPDVVGKVRKKEGMSWLTGEMLTCQKGLCPAVLVG